MSLPSLRLPKRIYPRKPKSLPLIDKYPLYGLSFDGVSGYMINGSPVGLPGGATTPFTLSFWGYLSSTVPDGTFFVGWGNPANNGQMCAIIQWNGDIFYWGNNADSGVAFDVGRWQLITVTFDGSNLTIYKNGTQIYRIGMTLYAMATQIFWIAYPVNPAFEHYLSGTIGEVCIYNRALSVAELQSNMRNPMNPLWNGLVLWLPMIEGAGTVVNDYSGLGNNGAICGGVSWYEMALHEPEADVP